jgi:hypothetical protein
MKTVLAAVFLCLLAANSLRAQARIIFSNTSASPIRIQNPGINEGVPVVLGNDSTPLFGFGPASAEIRLYAGLTSYDLTPVPIGLAADQDFVLNTSSTVRAAQGTFQGGFNLPLAGFDGSAPVFLQFTGWIPGTMYFGVSPTIQVSPANNAPLPPTQVFSATPDASHWNGLLITIPEPSSLALLVLGAGLVVSRRWQAQR